MIKRKLMKICPCGFQDYDRIKLYQLRMEVNLHFQVNYMMHFLYIKRKFCGKIGLNMLQMKH